MKCVKEHTKMYQKLHSIPNCASAKMYQNRLKYRRSVKMYEVVKN